MPSYGFAHAKLDVQLRQKQLIKKKYQAIVAGQIQELASHGEITYPIARDLSSLLKRKQVWRKSARTEYWLTKKDQQVAVVTILLHTGRTHQIRVHFAAIHCPLLGDELYGGAMDLGIDRQALHCCELALPILSAENRCILKQTCRQIWHQSNKQ